MPHTNEQTATPRESASSMPEHSALKIIKNLIAGGVGEALATTIDHPLWTIKTRIQAGMPFTLSPSVLYTGVFYNAISMMPITALQAGLDQGFRLLLQGQQKTALSLAEETIASSGSGALVACLSTPIERVMTQQQHLKADFIPTCRYIVKAGGMSGLFAGLCFTALRDGCYTAGVLCAMPFVKNALQTQQIDPSIAAAAAGSITGVATATITHPFDTIKSAQQNASPGRTLSATEAASHIYRQSGTIAFYAGLFPRTLRVIASCTLVGEVVASVRAGLWG